MKLIIGLGNPGKKYEQTNHNIGFMIIDLLAQKHGINLDQKKFSSFYGEKNIGGEKVILLKPQTYMNLSGQAAAAIVHFFKIDISDLLVIHDDLDLEPGKVRFRKKGSAGGHNGLKSLIEQLQTENFARVKVGIGKPLRPEQTESFVLQKISDSAIKESFKTALGKAEEWLFNIPEN